MVGLIALLFIWLCEDADEVKVVCSWCWCCDDVAAATSMDTMPPVGDIGEEPANGLVAGVEPNDGDERMASGASPRLPEGRTGSVMLVEGEFGTKAAS